MQDHNIKHESIHFVHKTLSNLGETLGFEKKKVFWKV